MAGEPKPWVMKLKWERQLWMPGSKMGEGLLLPSGVLSWANRSVNSLHSCLGGEDTGQDDLSEGPQDMSHTLRQKTEHMSHVKTIQIISE